MRPSQRHHDQMRAIKFQRQFTCHAEGSVLCSFGNTQVLCNASVIEGVPKFLRDSKQGWLTAEYGMLPRATGERMQREATRGHQGGRTLEIQRLIGRSLRAALDLKALKGYTLTLDCDVIQADGGTRTAAISGSCVALIDAIHWMKKQGLIKKDPLKFNVAAVSVGIYQGTPILDLDYAEDSNAQTDMNIVMSSENHFIEIQGTAEGNAFNHTELNGLLALAAKGIQEIIQAQLAVM